jgi:hypothetical protein
MAPKTFRVQYKANLVLYVSTLCGVYELRYTPEQPAPYLEITVRAQSGATLLTAPPGVLLRSAGG